MPHVGGRLLPQQPFVSLVCVIGNVFCVLCFFIFPFHVGGCLVLEVTFLAREARRCFRYGMEGARVCGWTCSPTPLVSCRVVGGGKVLFCAAASILALRTQPCAHPSRVCRAACMGTSSTFWLCAREIVRPLKGGARIKSRFRRHWYLHYVLRKYVCTAVQ